MWHTPITFTDDDLDHKNINAGGSKRLHQKEVHFVMSNLKEGQWQFQTESGQTLLIVCTEKFFSTIALNIVD